VRLDWLEWHGGSLRLTVTGDNVRHQAAALPRAGDGEPLAVAA
jgi:hypothetical protein